MTHRLVQKDTVDLLVFQRSVQQGFDEPLYGKNGSFQLVRDVTDELLAVVLDLVEAVDLMFNGLAVPVGTCGEVVYVIMMRTLLVSGLFIHTESAVYDVSHFFIYK